ncbi:MAG: hypothetical protein WCW31_05655 [Patescibacteria group bacterium]|jgi:hypothetical protein
MYLQKLKRGELGPGEALFIVMAWFIGLPAAIAALWINNAWLLLGALFLIVGWPALLLWTAHRRS